MRRQPTLTRYGHLSSRERSRLAEYERVIERGLQTFIRVGMALAEIRNQGLYRETHLAFKQYCQERWGIEHSYACRLVRAATVAESTTETVNYSQALALSTVPRERRGEVLTRAKTRGKLSARNIKIAAAALAVQPSASGTLVSVALTNLSTLAKSIQDLLDSPVRECVDKGSIALALQTLHKELEACRAD